MTKKTFPKLIEKAKKLGYKGKVETAKLLEELPPGLKINKYAYAEVEGKNLVPGIKYMVSFSTRENPDLIIASCTNIDMALLEVWVYIKENNI